MFNRRFLRVKVLQGLYAYLQGGSGNVNKAVSELHESVERSFDLLLYLLSILLEIDHQIELKIGDLRERSKARTDEISLSRKFQQNRVLKNIRESKEFASFLKSRAVSWQDKTEVIQRFFKQLTNWEKFNTYLHSKKNDYREDQEMIVAIYRDLIPETDLLSHAFQEKSIYWNDEDFDYVNFLIWNTLKKLGEEKSISDFIKPAYSNKDDKEFVEKLFRKTVEKSDEIEKLVMSKTQNWDSDRIAMVDMLLMKMTVAEVTSFNMIPVKVSMNEYIDISKSFSSPKSGQFINGILDKVVAELKEGKKIKKVGRGLIE